jgi:hypothetical protein
MTASRSDHCFHPIEIYVSAEASTHTARLVPRLRAVSLFVALLPVIGFGIGLLRLAGPDEFVLFFPPAMFPFAVNAILIFQWRTLGGQLLILFASLAYAALVAYVVLGLWNINPQGAIAFLYVGVFALPGLLLLWIVGGLIEWRRGVSTSSRDPPK